MRAMLTGMRRGLVVAGVLGGALLVSGSAWSQCTGCATGTVAEARKDPVLVAMLEELERSQSSLQLPGFQKPFFIQYRIEEVDAYQTRADYGASLGEERHHQRVARVTVRVGDYKTDSSTSRGDGSVTLAALDNDPLALRAGLWQATDQAYKQALAAYARKEAELKQVQTAPQADDFSHESAVISLESPAALEPGVEPYAELATRASGLYRTDPGLKGLASQIQYSTASFHARAVTTWLVNSEGTIVRKGNRSYVLSFAAGGQADDGMHLDRSYGSTGTRLKDLDDPRSFSGHVVSLVASLGDLRKAPLVEEEYHGPVLVSADAAADVVHDLLTVAVTAQRPELGTEARTKGPFASSLHTRVLPEFLSVTDDPLVKEWDGKGLAGSYAVDDEGVRAQAVPVVVDGRLENYLIGRQPVKDFPQSNGHGRAPISGTPQPFIGVLEMKAKDGLSATELESKLQEQARGRGLKSVYFVETMGPEMTPRLLYRLGSDGKRELVRGGALDDLDLRAMRSGVVAAGKDVTVTNYNGAIGQTVMAPALLFEDLTVKRANEKNDKLPYYPAPE